MITNVTGKTRDLVNNWARTRRHTERQRRQLSEDEKQLSAAQSQLGKWLCDAGDNQFHDGEWINIWFGSGILRARRSKGDIYEVEWLKEPDGKDRTETEW